MTKIPQPTNWNAKYDLIYDAWNRLVQVKQGATVIASYENDGFGRWIAKTSGGVTEDYDYNAGYQIIEVRRAGTMREQLVWKVDYVDSLAVRFNDFHNGSGGVADGDFLDLRPSEPMSAYILVSYLIQGRDLSAVEASLNPRQTLGYVMIIASFGCPAK
jgi:hypothetical protein